MNKKVICFVTLLCIFIFGIVSYAEEQELHCCNTDKDLINEIHNTLWSKKTNSIGNNILKNDITLFQYPITTNNVLMPSTGDVKMLVLPIEFNDEKLSDDICSKLEKHFLGKQDISNASLQYKDLSVCDYFKKISFNKLRLSGIVLPVYSATENRNYYEYNSELGKSPLPSEIAKAIELNKDIIGDLSEYDADGDGYIDCIHVITAGPSGDYAGHWWPQIKSGENVEIYNNIKINRFTCLPESNSSDRSPVHEMGHLMGLPDNYSYASTGKCAIPDGCYDLMNSGYYVNAFYKYLLDWENPDILPYENITKEIKLYPSDIYNETTIDKTRTVMFIPDTSLLPYTEFYIMEYRADREGDYKINSGIIVWHINIKKNTSISVGAIISEDYIKPVYKSNDETEFKNDDLYRIDNSIGDEWSSDSTPSSNFYNDVYTGAYMKVLGIDDEKATIQAGFKNPDLSSAPSITISPPSKKAVKSSEKCVTYTITYEANNIGSTLKLFQDVEINHTGSASTLQGMEAPIGNVVTFKMENLKGEGTLGITVKGQSIWNISSLGGKKYALPVTSETFFVDDTPPEITLNGDSEITLQYGEQYIEQGAKITDNLDPEIESKLKISGTVDTSKAGTYKVYYDITDHANNKAQQVIRTITVLEPENCLVKFVNYNGDILQSSAVAYGAMPEYTGETPLKAQDECYAYIFSGWSPTITAVSGEATYTAQFTAIPRVYNVTLNANGGEVENPITEYTYGIGATLPVPTRTGYTFNDWYYDETYSGAVVTEISATDTGDKAYYAKWTPNIYTVTYDYDEATGGNSVKTKTVVYDSEYGTLPTPSKIGCIFDGWNTADNIKVTSETIVSIAENHTLRAQWADCPHTWDSGKITKNATCTATGTALFTCTICADTKTEEIAMLSHTEVTDLRVEPTCTENGKTEGSHCSVCNTVIKAQEVISATGHTENSGEITKPPTCTETGMMTYKCTKCSEIVRTESISASGHVIDESEWYKDSENHWRECGVCHEKPEEETHIKDSGTVTKQPTTEENGIREYKCTVCGFVMQTEPIEKLDSPIEPSDRIEFERQEDGTILAKLIFEKTTPPKSDDITMYITYYKDSKLMRVDIPLRTKMSALIDIDETLADCEIKVFVWDKNMKPLMEAQNIHK